MSLVLTTVGLPTLEDIVQPNLRDITFRVTVESAYRTELRKINKDFAISYEAKEATVWWKEPMKLRLKSVMNGSEVTYTIVGFRKWYTLPRLGNVKTEDIKDAPGKHQTLLDFGIITNSMREEFLRGTYVRTDVEGFYIFDIRYKSESDPSRHRVWVDPKRRYIAKRMWYNRRGELMATFEYSDPIQVSGVWFPTKLTVLNAEGKIAGVSRYQEIRVNTGMPDSLFR